jgi:hypothetical protein
VAEAITLRGVRSLIILLIIAIPLGWYALRESKKEAPTSDKKLEKVFSGVEADKIDQVTIKSESGDRTTVQKQSSKWQVTAPVTAAADEGELSGLTSNLSSLEMQRVVDEQPADLKQYGLQPARVEVGFKAGGQERHLLVGQKTPTGTDLYAKLPDKPRVFLISSYLDSTFNKSTFDLRDKTVLKFDREKVDSLEIASADRTLKFAKKGPDWRMTAPVDARADFSAIEGVVGRLNTAQMKALTAPDATDLKPYGLDKPAYTVRLGAGSAQAALAIGKSAGEGVFYAKDLSRPLIFTVESALVDELKKPADDFRVKDLFDARAFNINRIEATRGGQTVAFEKSKGAAKGNEPPPEVWKQVTPSAKDVDSSKMDTFISALTNARATSFVDKTAGTGLDAPELTVSIKYEDNQKQERVAFGRHGQDAFAHRDGEPGAAKIDASALDALVKALDALK